jgi:hypothetical protein
VNAFTEEGSLLRIAASVGAGNAVIGGLLVAASFGFAVEAAAFESQMWPGSLPSSAAAVSGRSWDRVEGSPDAVGGWVVISYAMSVDCSPPRACYASSQWVYGHAYCAMGAFHEMQRLSLDLNGNVQAASGERVRYIPRRGTVDRAVVRTLCRRGRDADSDADD